jgi:1-deoxy-D-xylulose-5-phosphate reductoisomerase
LSLARHAGTVGGTLPSVMNAANEVAVEAFCQRTLTFPQISETVARVMSAHQVIPHPNLDDLMAADAWARAEAARS